MKDITNFLDILLYYLFPYRSGNHQATIYINSFTAWVIQQALESKTKGTMIIHDFDEPFTVDWSKIIAIKTSNNNILHIAIDESLKNMEIKHNNK